MTPIKSYTDLEQSKKLAEILPLESADMYYISGDECDICFGNGVYEEIADWLSNGTPKPADIPCWSLASLLELLPKRLEIEDNVYELSIYLYGLYYYNIINGNLCFESKDKDNLVDACYDEIVFLHEQKLL